LAGARSARRRFLDESAAHYNEHRPLQARNLRPPDGGDIAMAAISDVTTARIRLRSVLGGLINEYQRAARSPEASRKVAAQRLRRSYATVLG
jgi:hypothetical protein